MSNNIDNEIAQGYADFADDTDVTVENSENISEVVDNSRYSTGVINRLLITILY